MKTDKILFHQNTFVLQTTLAARAVRTLSDRHPPPLDVHAEASESDTGTLPSSLTPHVIQLASTRYRHSELHSMGGPLVLFTSILTDMTYSRAEMYGPFSSLHGVLFGT